MANKLREGCPVSRVTGEIQVKTTIKDRVTPVRMAITQRQEMTGVGKDMEEREPLYTVGGNAN